MCIRKVGGCGSMISSAINLKIMNTKNKETYFLTRKQCGGVCGTPEV